MISWVGLPGLEPAMSTCAGCTGAGPLRRLSLPHHVPTSTLAEAHLKESPALPELDPQLGRQFAGKRERRLRSLITAGLLPFKGGSFLSCHRTYEVIAFSPGLGHTKGPFLPPHLTVPAGHGLKTSS